MLSWLYCKISLHFQCKCLWKIIKSNKRLKMTIPRFQNPYIVVGYLMLLKRSHRDRTPMPCKNKEYCKTGTKKNARSVVWEEVLWNLTYEEDPGIAHIISQKLCLPAQNPGHLAGRVNVVLEPKPSWSDIGSW